MRVSYIFHAAEEDVAHDLAERLVSLLQQVEADFDTKAYPRERVMSELHRVLEESQVEVPF